MGWYCPECGEFNERDDNLKCPCGREVSEALLPSLKERQVLPAPGPEEEGEKLKPDGTPVTKKRTLEYSIIMLLYSLAFAGWFALFTYWGFVGLIAGAVILVVLVGAVIFYFKRLSNFEK